MKSLESHYTRTLLASRKALLSKCINLENEVRLQLYQAYLELDRRVKRLANNDAVCLLLMTTPGVGAITTLTFRAAVDDPRRFRRSRTVADHLGLTPRRYQSGERTTRAIYPRLVILACGRPSTQLPTPSCRDPANGHRSQHGACACNDPRAANVLSSPSPASSRSSSMSYGWTARSFHLPNRRLCNDPMT